MRINQIVGYVNEFSIREWQMLFFLNQFLIENFHTDKRILRVFVRNCEVIDFTFSNRLFSLKQLSFL